MGNGGVYGMDGFYAGPEGSTYTPHLLPIFQQPQPFATPQDTNNLEDASVLLSIAYGSEATPEPATNHPTVLGQRVVADDWGPEPNLNMMMEATADVAKDRSKSGTTTASASTIEGEPTPTDVHQVGNFLNAMNWLGSWAKEGTTPGEGANQWVSYIEARRVPYLAHKCGTVKYEFPVPFPKTTLSLSRCLAPLPIAGRAFESCQWWRSSTRRRYQSNGLEYP
jgi:hypothetical protein